MLWYLRKKEKDRYIWKKKKGVILWSWEEIDYVLSGFYVYYPMKQFKKMAEKKA